MPNEIEESEPIDRDAMLRQIVYWRVHEMSPSKLRASLDTACDYIEQLCAAMDVCQEKK